MVDDSKVIERTGGYYVLQCDSAYAMFSGYEHIVCYQPPTLCQPKQLAGFGKGRLDDALKYMRNKASKGAEEKRFRRTEMDVKAKLAAGWLPCEPDDVESRQNIRSRGYAFAEYSGSLHWFSPPANKDAGLFDKPKAL